MDTVRKCAIALVLCALSASQGFSQAGVEEAFDQLVASHQAIAGENAESQRVELVAQWVQVNDWRSLPLADKAWLHAELLALDQVDRNSFSVRWTGTITAPATKEYVFSQHFLPGAYGGAMKLWIDDRLVLDTSAAPKRLGFGPQLEPSAEGAYDSQPVPLSQESPASFRVEYVYHDEFPEFDDEARRWRFPRALLLWGVNDAERQIVPTAVFAPPADFDSAESSGLRAEYFRDRELSGSAGEFWEPGVQRHWSKRPVLPRYKRLQEEILAAIRDQVVSPPGLAEGDAVEFIRTSFGKTLPGLSVADRKSAMEHLAAEASLLNHLDIATFAAWMPHVAGIPGAPHADTIVSWSELYRVPPSRMAIARGYGAGSYAAANYRFYREAGLWFNGPEWLTAKRLIDENLENADGTCNLLLSYVVAFSSRYEHAPGHLVQAIAKRVDDSSLSADARATWLWARSHADELFSGGLPQPQRAISSLEEALLTCDDSDLRFRLFEELVVHLASSGQTDRAASFITAHTNQFQQPDQVAKIADLQAQLTALAERINQLNATSADSQLAASRATAERILLRRQQRSADRGQE